MTGIEMLEPVGNVFTGCLHCGSKPGELCMSSNIHPGFGMVTLTRDGETVYPLGADASYDEIEELVVQDYEAVAAGDPDHDWRLKVDAPLYDITYQRQGEGRWVAVAKGMGFA